jgi:organic hydroperoxide reductase OsmC/OhrA
MERRATSKDPISLNHADRDREAERQTGSKPFELDFEGLRARRCAASGVRLEAPRASRAREPPAGVERERRVSGTRRSGEPEQLLLAAASSCQLLSFLGVAARARIEVVAYIDEAEAVMSEDHKPMRITRVVLRPPITVAAGTDLERVLHLVQRAHAECFIANTLNAEVVVEARVVHAHDTSSGARTTVPPR